MVRLLPVVILATACAPRLYTDDGGTGDPVAWVAPENSYRVNVPPAELVGEGMDEGQIAYDIRGMDQHGDEVSMWQFYGRLILVDLSTMWCGPCQELAMGTEEVYQHFKDDDVVYLTVLHENDLNEPVNQEELELWASLPSVHPDDDHPYDVITAPILSDPKGVSGSIEAIKNNQYPVALLVGRDMRVLERIEPVTEDNITLEIEAALAAE